VTAELGEVHILTVGTPQRTGSNATAMSRSHGRASEPGVA
jgi:hypothetical protein